MLGSCNVSVIQQHVKQSPMYTHCGSPSRTLLHHALMSWRALVKSRLCGFGLQLCTRRGAVSMEATQASKHASRTRIVAVGDVHGLWDDTDAQALKCLEPDVVVFVGDFGEEDVELVRKANECPFPTLVMLGNHDAWTCLNAKRRKSNSGTGGWDDKNGQDPAAKVREQLAINGERNLAWNCKQLEGKPVSIVGGRPFSQGGEGWNSIAPFYRNLYECLSYEEASDMTVSACQEAPETNSIVLVGHNGPKGLGEQQHSPCGVDFRKEAGDFGDPDSEQVLWELKQLKRSPVLMLFGHMHSHLQQGGRRQMIGVSHGTVCVNTAEVPRWKTVEGIRRHHFTICDLSGTEKPVLQEVRSVWVAPDSSDESESGVSYSIVDDEHLYRIGGHFFDTHSGQWGVLQV